MPQWASSSYLPDLMKDITALNLINVGIPIISLYVDAISTTAEQTVCFVESSILPKERCRSIVPVIRTSLALKFATSNHEDCRTRFSNYPLTLAEITIGNCSASASPGVGRNLKALFSTFRFFDVLGFKTTVGATDILVIQRFITRAVGNQRDGTPARESGAAIISFPFLELLGVFVGGAEYFSVKYEGGTASRKKVHLLSQSLSINLRSGFSGGSLSLTTLPVLCAYGWIYFPERLIAKNEVIHLCNQLFLKIEVLSKARFPSERCCTSSSNPDSSTCWIRWLGCLLDVLGSLPVNDGEFAGREWSTMIEVVRVVGFSWKRWNKGYWREIFGRFEDEEEWRFEVEGGRVFGFSKTMHFA
ncbi:uncharacterized protein G2W53_003826 [Senna tora]|uniref:Uncharacterized protein n=1 Tax=Senna tora TaxID=362788 RepID=A0A834XE67_9FABA|nr:uncharacterized protein G2W53_003826 [Senna tora]